MCFFVFFKKTYNSKTKETFSIINEKENMLICCCNLFFDRRVAFSEIEKIVERVSNEQHKSPSQYQTSTIDYLESVILCI